MKLRRKWQRVPALSVESSLTLAHPHDPKVTIILLVLMQI